MFYFYLNFVTKRNYIKHKGYVNDIRHHFHFIVDFAPECCYVPYKNLSDGCEKLKAINKIKIK